MSRHRLPLLLPAVLFSVALIAAPALADRIPSAVKTSSTPSPKPISDFLATQLPNLASTDPLVQKQARESIISECAGHVGLSASPEYGTMYATLLSKALMPITASPSIRTRVNVGVVVASVAAQVYHDGGSAAGLQPVVEKLLKDSQPAVVLWGAKAAKYVIGSDLLHGENPSALDKILVQAVKNHPDSGPIVEEAFVSLTLEDGAFAKLKGGTQFPQAATVLVPELLDLIGWRGDQYKAGATPPSPLAEQPATVFIPVTIFQGIQANPAMLNQTLKVMGDTTCSTIRFLANGTPTPNLVDMAKDYGRAFDAFGQQMPNANVQKAGKAIADMSQNTDPTRMGKLCDDLTDALKSAGVNLANGNGPGAGEPAPPPAIAGSTK